jgi:hypothetical protein
VSKLTDEAIKAIINAHIKETLPENYDDELLPLDGGLWIQYDDKIIEYQCCSELNDYQEWEKIITEKSQTWEAIWIGHPWIFYRYKDIHIELSDYYEGTPEQEAIQTKMVFYRDDFIKKLQHELSVIQSFKARVYQVIDNGAYQNKDILKQKLIY